MPEVPTTCRSWSTPGKFRVPQHLGQQVTLRRCLSSGPIRFVDDGGRITVARSRPSPGSTAPARPGVTRPQSSAPSRRRTSDYCGGRCGTEGRSRGATENRNVRGLCASEVIARDAGWILEAKQPDVLRTLFMDFGAGIAGYFPDTVAFLTDHEIRELEKQGLWFDWTEPPRPGRVWPRTRRRRWRRRALGERRPASRWRQGRRTPRRGHLTSPSAGSHQEPLPHLTRSSPTPQGPAVYRPGPARTRKDIPSSSSPSPPSSCSASSSSSCSGAAPYAPGPPWPAPASATSSPPPAPHPSLPT